MDFGCLFYAWIEFVSLLQEEEDVLVCMKWPCIIEVKTDLLWTSVVGILCSFLLTVEWVLIPTLKLVITIYNADNLCVVM